MTPMTNAPMSGPSHPDYVVDCVEVKSGDAIVVEDRTGTRKRVSVHGIAAPEADQPYGPAATQAARQAVEGKRVEVEVTGKTPDGHLVGRVRANRTNLGPLLVRNGLAWHDHRQAPEETSLRALQRQARADGRGLWTEQNPVPPWESREGNAALPASVRKLVERARSLMGGRASRDTPVASTE